MSRFNHLHAHSHYSLLSALPKVPDLVHAAKDGGFEALALTDNGSMYGTIEFFKECKKAGIKPIVGVDAYMAPRTRHDKQSGIDSRRARLIILVKNAKGYKNLMDLVTLSNTEGFYYKPRIDREILEKYREGLIVIIPAMSSELSIPVQVNDKPKSESIVAWYKEQFGDDFYIEITHHDDIDSHEEMMRRTIDLARRTNTQIVAGQEVYYLKPEDKLAQRTLMLISSTGEAVDRSQLEDDGDFSFISKETAETLFRETPDALENCGKIVDKITLDIELGKWVFPAFTIESGATPDEELRRVVYEGFERRNIEKVPKLIERVDYELTVIKNKGYSPYFLIVADLLKYARSHGILSNIRGSVSGSMVTYLAGITNIDPIEYEIPFERFLNPDRPSAPDIDMDFADNRRDEMVEYARIKYGRDKVAQIGTFGTMAARGSVRDVTRALGYPIDLGDRIAKLIPMGSQGFTMTIDHALETVAELKELHDKDKDVARVIAMAKKIEGCARHISIHAAGVVISPTELTDFSPLQFDPKGEKKIISQYDMYSIEEAGLLKFDFLGLKNLSIIADALTAIEKNHGVTLTVDTIPIDDKHTFEMLARGETSDLFQLNGEGMTKYLKELRPSTIHDINAMVALYRPGPIQFIPEYIARKHDRSLIKYLDPALEPILDKTYGILVYQDDLLMMAHKLAGYSWGEVDKFRKAVGKKIPEEMAAQKEKFIAGCVKYSGWGDKKARQVWTWIEPFASYGFNKAHSVSYGKVAYITAYLKANYPGEYMSAILTHEAGDLDKVSESIAECRRLGIEVLPPSINYSDGGFTLIKLGGGKQQIRFGLHSVKNFGEGIAGVIIEERKRGGLFIAITDFLERIRDRNLNKKSLEALIKAGALDELITPDVPNGRAGFLGNLDTLLEFNKESSKTEGQDSLFGLMGPSSVSKITFKHVPPMRESDKLMWEKELLGLYVSGHPLDKYKAIIEARGITVRKIREQAAIEKEKTGKVAEKSIVVAGIIEDVRIIMTKKNDPMCFMKFADLTGSIDVVVFPKTFALQKTHLIKDTCLAIKGKVSERNDELSVALDGMKVLA
jgi:DNA polymerase-3 subunit alpha